MRRTTVVIIALGLAIKAMSVAAAQTPTAPSWQQFIADIAPIVAKVHAAKAFAFAEEKRSQL